jgi:hypothetical protein
MLGFEPATEIAPALSVCPPACVVSVEIALVDPSPREPIATGRSSNSRPVLVSAMLETSVVITASAGALAFTDSTPHK